MNWSLFLLFCIVVAILALFKSHDNFKGGRGFRMSGGYRGPFTIVDAVILVLVVYYLFINIR